MPKVTQLQRAEPGFNPRQRCSRAAAFNHYAILPPSKKEKSGVKDSREWF